MKLKKLSFLVVVLFAVFISSSNVKAANSVNLSCTPETISIVGGTSETALCTVSIVVEASIKNVQISMDSSKYLLISNVKANSVWTQSSAAASDGVYFFEATSGSVPAGEYEVFSFNLTLDPGLAQIEDPQAVCGQLCISQVQFDRSSVLDVSKGRYTCFGPTVEIEECEEGKCESPNPETGAFANVLLLIGGVSVAIIAVVIAKKNNKFFRV